MVYQSSKKPKCCMGVNNFHFYYRNINDEFPGIFRYVLFFLFLIISWLFLFLCLFMYFLIFFCFYRLFVRRPHPPSAVRRPPSVIRRPLSASAVRIRTLQSPPKFPKFLIVLVHNSIRLCLLEFCLSIFVISCSYLSVPSCVVTRTPHYSTLNFTYDEINNFSITQWNTC